MHSVGGLVGLQPADSSSPHRTTTSTASNSPLAAQEAALRLADSVGATARSIGAVNTLVRQAEGSLAAHNTDWTAAIGAIEAGLTGRLPQQEGALAPGRAWRLSRACAA